MLTVAYLANEFPVPVEPYVGEEILELRRRGVHVIAGTVRRSRADPPESPGIEGAGRVLCLQPVRLPILLQTLRFALRRGKRIANLMARVLLGGRESPARRAKALLHTCLGAYYAAQLQEDQVDHIHVHHGYFGSWIAMVAAQLLEASFSLTLHGSDLLLNGAYLDTKLKNCQFCVTISEYNRRYILQEFPAIDPGKIVVARLGADARFSSQTSRSQIPGPARCSLTLLAVGRLHAVKDHAFLVRACARLRDCGLDFECVIGGEGPERQRLESLIGQYGLHDRVRLLGHVPRHELDPLYQRADVVALTSRSEGLPLVLMEAMARGKIVLAPAITGIPELVIPGKTGFLYVPGTQLDFVARILFLSQLIRDEDRNSVSRLDWIRHAARIHVLHNFSRGKNLHHFADQFVRRIASKQIAE
jgi:colanic acid/amylovoran biosynthesis glycosyltransferase